jgi:hypothetical protein
VTKVEWHIEGWCHWLGTSSIDDNDRKPISVRRRRPAIAFLDFRSNQRRLRLPDSTSSPEGSSEVDSSPTRARMADRTRSRGEETIALFTLRLDPRPRPRGTIARMLGEVDNVARWIGVCGLLIGLSSLAYGVFRDRRDRPQVDFKISIGEVFDKDSCWAQMRLVARNRGSRDVGVENIDLDIVQRHKGCGSVQFIYAGHGEEWRLDRSRTLLARHSLEWQAIPRIICEAVPSQKMHLRARLLLGTGEVIESNAVAVPVEALADDPYLRSGPESLNDRAWFRSLGDTTDT